MASIGDYKVVAGKKYKVMGISWGLHRVPTDLAILRKHGYKARYIRDDDLKWKKIKRYLILGRK